MISLLKFIGYGAAIVLVKIISAFFGLIFSDAVVSFFAAHRGLFASLAIHSALLLGVLHGMPSVHFFVDRVFSEQVLVLDVVEMGEFTNVPVGLGSKDVKDDKDSLEPDSYKPPDSEQGSVQSAVNSPKNQKDSEALDLQQSKTNENKVLERETTEKPKVTKEDKAKNLTNILKSIKKKSEVVKKGIDGEEKLNALHGRGEAQFNKSKPITISTIDRIRSKFISCWKVPYGAKNAETLKVVIYVKLGMDGQLLSTKVKNMSRYYSDSFFRAMADSAVRAVIKCSPIDFLPKDRYSTWSEIELNFDPAGMFR